jgi:ATP-binding cassette, subfamily B, bacterial PglK
MKTTKKLLFLFSTQQPKQFILLMIMILIMALLDAIGIASILPFMTVLTNPDLIETNLILNENFSSLLAYLELKVSNSLFFFWEFLYLYF